MSTAVGPGQRVLVQVGSMGVQPWALNSVSLYRGDLCVYSRGPCTECPCTGGIYVSTAVGPEQRVLVQGGSMCVQPWTLDRVSLYRVDLCVYSRGP